MGVCRTPRWCHSVGRCDGGFIANDVLAMVEAAKQGMGLAHVLEDLVTEHVAAGRLVRVLEPWCPPMYRFHLYFPGTPRMPGKPRVFIDFLRTHSGHDA
ncbi:MAG: hypothetical protein I4O48_03120 [Ralstonia sp.]|nr:MULTISPECIES: LysR substrate-binding domain-containing protein [Ralstonia]MCL6467298.1 hypothetical protein [Ralstonia sp.]